MTDWKVCRQCGERVLVIDRGHPERCRGFVLKQPVYRADDWAGKFEDEDAGDRRVAPYLGDDMGREP